jgi:hypothetical protein
MSVEGRGTTEAPVGTGKATQLAAEKAYDEIAEREGLDEYGDEVVDMSGDDEPVVEAEEPGEDTDPEVDEPEEEIPAAAEAEDQEGEEEPSAQTEASPATPVLAPHTWPDDWKQAFNAVNPQMQGIMVEQHKLMNKAFSSRMMELGKRRRELEGVEKAISPHIQRLHRAGIGPETAVMRALGWDEHIQKDPQQGIRDMAQAYGVNLGELSKPSAQERYMTPAERALQEENRNLAGRLENIEQSQARYAQAQQQSAWRQRQARAYRMLQEFMNATDDKGNQLHPYIEHVAPTMTKLIDNGMAEDLEDAYNKATAMSPQIREARDTFREAKRKEDARKAAQKARKASGGIVETGGRRGKAKGQKTFEDRVAETYDKIANA